MLLRDSQADPAVKAGSKVYELVLPDFGCAVTDAQTFGQPCLSVTLRADGEYPFFVVPVADLRVID